MPDFTNVFTKVYDVTRKVADNVTSDLNLYDNDGGVIETIQTGWVVEEQQIPNGRVITLRVTDRDGADFASAVFFGWGGFKYERNGFPVPPTGNPREWIWEVKPVGVDE
jgi:hypothetical protein